MLSRTLLHPRHALLAGLILLSAPATSRAEDRAGEVTQINQSGLQVHAGRTRFLDLGDTVVRNARLETDQAGEMAVSMDDGSQLVLLPDSDIVIDSFVYDPDHVSGEVSLSLGRGALRMISGRLPSERYRLTTSVATVGVRGTDFTVQVTGRSELMVRVHDGAVEISPIDSTERFTATTGQTVICSVSGCRAATPEDGPLRRAELGPPLPGEPGATLQRAQAGQSGADGQVIAAVATSPGSATQCPPYRIPGDAYRRVGLAPARWPAVVEGITFHRHHPSGLTKTRYCPDRIAFADNGTGFSVMGRSAAGDTKILYYVNSFPGQAFFQPGFDRHAQAQSDADAYRAFMPRVFGDQPTYRIDRSDAALRRSAPDRVVLQQTIHAHVRHGAYLVTGITLYRPAQGGRTGLFSVPVVITDRGAGTSGTARRIGEPLFRQISSR